MAALLAEAMRAHRRGDRAPRADADGDATEAADAAIKASAASSTSTTRGMAELLEVDDLREVMARRELYRRCSRIGETVVDVAERVIYAVVKES